jgi:exonuclease III
MIKLLSYNVNFAGARSPELAFNERTIVRAIADAAADVVVLQETHRGWERVLNECIDETVYPFRWFHDESFDSSGGIAILSRVPFRNPTVVFPNESVPGSWFPAAFAELLLDDDNDDDASSLWLGVIHLRPPVFDAGKATPMTMTNTSPIRKAELTVLLDAMALAANCADRATLVAQRRVVVAGDANENCNHSGESMLATAGVFF